MLLRIMEPCQVCGDVGFDDLLQTCSICREVHEHLYCMDFKLSEVPTTWNCKACQLQIEKGQEQSKEQKILAEHLHVHSKGTDEHLFEMPSHKTVLPPTCKVGTHKFKGPQTGKVKFLPTEAVLGMRSRGRPKASSMYSGPGPRPNNVDVSYNPMSRRNPAVCTVASPGSANQKGLAQESPRHSKLPTFANMQAGTHNSQSKSFPCQTPSLCLKSSGTRKMAGRSDLRRLSGISNKEISAGSSENFLKIKEEDKPKDHKDVNNNYRDSIGATQSLGKRKNISENQMTVCDATNIVNSTCVSQMLEEIQVEEDRPACARVSSVLNKEKSFGGLEDLGMRMEEGGPKNCMRIMDVADKDKSTGDSKSPGKGKIKEDEPEDEINIMHASKEEEPTGALESSGKRETQEDPEDCLKIMGQIHKEKSTGKKAKSIPSKFLEKNGLPDGILSHTHGTSESKTVSEQGEFLNPPVTKASWNGSFAVADIFGINGVKDTYDGLRAHLPKKVSRKAYEVVKRLPKMVKLQLYRRCDMWPHIFNEDGSSKYDIALYFLPGDLGRSIDYYCLLELIEKEDMMMRSFIGGVELLLFSSKKLPLNSQTFNAQLYLWGIFRSRKGSSATYIRATQENDAVQDMEIDMIGGVDVGRVDIPLRKQTYAGREMSLRKETAKFSFSNSLIFKRKSAESHGREIGGDKARTTDCNNQVATSLPSLSFKLHGRKMIERSAIQDRSNENTEELIVKSSSSSSPEFPPGFTKPVKVGVPPSCSNEPFKIGSPSAVRVNSRRFSELPRMSKDRNYS